MKRSRRVAGVALAWLSQCAMTGTGLRAFTSGCAVKIPATAGLSWRQPGDISPTAFDSSAVFFSVAVATFHRARFDFRLLLHQLLRAAVPSYKAPFSRRNGIVSSCSNTMGAWREWGSAVKRRFRSCLIPTQTSCDVGSPVK
jgi:hypothetical protein